jgi:hypothetical protein
MEDLKCDQISFENRIGSLIEKAGYIQFMDECQ